VSQKFLKVNLIDEPVQEHDIQGEKMFDSEIFIN
jgi:hypothetical protein